MIPESFTSNPVFEKLEQLHQALSSDTAKEKIQLQDASFFEATEGLFLFVFFSGSTST